MDKIGETCDASDTGNDEVIANLLQTQFNREYDTMLKRTEEKFNRDSKGDKTCQFPFYMIVIIHLEVILPYFSEHLI